MRYFLFAVILGFFYFLPTMTVQSAERVFSLDEAVSRAVTNNFDILALEHEKEIQAEIVQGSLLRMLPSLVLEAERSWKSDDVPSRSKNYATGEESLAPSISSDIETKKETVGLSWNLLNLALEINRYRQEKTRGGLNEARMQRLRQNIALDVFRIYLQAQIAKKSAELAVNLRKKIRDRIVILRRQIEKSTVNEIEGIENEIKLLILKYNFHSFETDYKKAKAQLAKFMGLTPDTDFELEDLDFLSEAPAIDIDLAAFETEALTARPELMEIDVGRQITREEATGTLIKMFPTITPFVKYEHNANSYLERHDWRVTGLKFSWDLLSIPRHMSDRRIARGKDRKQAANRLGVAAAILTQIRLAVNDYREIADVIIIVKKIAQKRKQLMDAVNRMVKAGQSKETALLETEQRYHTAQIDYYSAFAKLCIAVAKINNTLGRNWEHTGETIIVRTAGTTTDVNALTEKDVQNVNVMISETASFHQPTSPKEKKQPETTEPIEPLKVIADLQKTTDVTDHRINFHSPAPTKSIKQVSPHGVTDLRTKSLHPTPVYKEAEVKEVSQIAVPRNSAPNDSFPAENTARTNTVLKASIDNLEHKAKIKTNKSNSSHALPYSIILAHFRNKEYAVQAAKDCTAKGITTYMVPVDLKKSGRWWRLYAGFFHDRAEAMKAAQDYNFTDFQIIEKRFTNLVNTYSSKKQIVAELHRVRSLGFYPYQMEISPTEYRLFVGAYNNREDAEQDILALREKGIEGQVVRR